MRIRLHRATLIIAFCCFCIASVIAFETRFIVTSLLGHVKMDTWLGAFVPMIFVLIINKKSFSYTILFLYLLVATQVTWEAWDMYNGVRVNYTKSVTPSQGLMVIVSTLLFAAYLVLALVNLVLALIRSLTSTEK